MNPSPIRFTAALLALFLAIPAFSSRAAMVDFTESAYTIGLGALLTFDIEILYEPTDPGSDDLFSYGVRLVPAPFTPFDPDPGDILIAAVPELNFDAFNGPPATIDKDPGVLGVKGTVDVLSGPFVPYDGAIIATFGLKFLAEGVFTLGLDFFNTLGPTEMIFVTGDGAVLDPFITFGTTTVTVIPEPSRALLLLLGFGGMLFRRRR